LEDDHKKRMRKDLKGSGRGVFQNTGDPNKIMKILIQLVTWDI